jgi:hypothetical protein
MKREKYETKIKTDLNSILGRNGVEDLVNK